MTEYDARNPLEIKILRNISFLDIGSNRLWCNVAIIEPVQESLLGYSVGQIRGFQNTLFEPSFTRFYGKHEEVKFRMKKRSPHGELKVGEETYHVEANNIKGTRKVLYQARKFSKGYPELWDYLSQFANITRVIRVRPFEWLERSD